MLLNGKWLCCQSCHHQNLQRVYLKIEQYWILYDMLYIYIYIYDMIWCFMWCDMISVQSYKPAQHGWWTEETLPWEVQLKGFRKNEVKVYWLSREPQRFDQKGPSVKALQCPKLFQFVTSYGIFCLVCWLKLITLCVFWFCVFSDVFCTVVTVVQSWIFSSPWRPIKS
jgi:hypothetical protein